MAEAEAIVAEAEQAGEQLQPTAEVEETVSATEEDTAAIAEIEAIDEEALLEALIRDEEESKPEETEPEETLSVDDLATFTLDEVMEEDEEEEEDLFPDLPEVPVLTPDAGKIRFAEDLVGETRGGGRGGRRGRAQHGWRSEPGRKKRRRQVTESLPGS